MRVSEDSFIFYKSGSFSTEYEVVLFFVSACRLMFEHISHVAYDSICYKDGTEHYIKRIPCPKGELCPDDASNTSYVVKENQFTYAISDPNQPK